MRSLTDTIGIVICGFGIFATLSGCFLGETVSAGQRRYVVPTGVQKVGLPLWTDASWAASCTKATVSGSMTDKTRFCDEGFSGMKPKVGTVEIGAEVEVLDSSQCRDMAHVRVLTGSLKNETGCIVASALSNTKPPI